ncbi:hypothetical protein Hanom_Chr10g00872981 [Helianthus anomalus]
MKTRQSSRSRRLLEVLRVYKAAEGLLLLANSPPLEVTGNEEPSNSAFHKHVGTGCESRWLKYVGDEGVVSISADALTERCLANRKGGCLLVYRCRNRRCFVSFPGDQVTVIADDKPTVDPLS